ncbi:hypothetical protein SAMN04487968_102103 [Nocardioides terrae]|uniref:Coenzyme PQQ synthesis protein D (PqqD) n=1 Tax=Nocardioides terrae TaxID=574651 RepID=A0A1I1EQN0_9ACTN|nr:hypothetical protein [Nocardioides terrae]SFB87183.1 hypothetical protein SAMN04487968_102103 [Nocardioides terrae]
MRIVRRPVTDELLIDGELVVLIDDQVLVLSEVASTALHGLVTDVWTSSEDLTACLEASVGLPEEGESAVFALVSSLESAGLVDVDR